MEKIDLSSIDKKILSLKVLLISEIQHAIKNEVGEGELDDYILKIFFETMRETVGIREECKGIKYRPYDGKVRPKSWEDFDNGVVYWKTKAAFLKGIENSKKYRWKELAKENVKHLTQKEKKEFRDIYK
jgi:hypothetical protein